ncbi:MAG TPA: GxxExxY protein [Acetobacteraceae bacterium]|nr:GxxExxY protein [Acetobacteraceae bacterium]
MNSDRPERDAVSERIIACAFTVANTLGSGFLEKVYKNALTLELRAGGFAVEQQRPIGVTYKGVLVGGHFAGRGRNPDRTEDGAGARWRASCAMHQLPAGHWETALSADQFRQAAYRGSTDCR